jgi:hypothetical protein
MSMLNNAHLRRLLFMATAISLGIVIGLVVAEFTLRALVKLNILTSKNRYVMLLNDIEIGSLYRRSNDPTLHYEFTPQSRRNFIRINSIGFRGKDIGRERPAGTIRIAVLGDSESAGLLMPEQDTFPGSLERALNVISIAEHYEVIDFSVPGYNINQKARILDKALVYHPSIVILYYVFNDPEPQPNGIFFDHSPFINSYLYVLFKYRYKLTRPTFSQIYRNNGAMVDYFQQLHSSPYFDQCQKVIVNMGRVLRAQNIRFIVVIAPELLGFADFSSYPHRNIHDKLRALTSQGIEVFDPLDYLAASGYRPTDLWVNQFDCHKGKLANAIIAGNLAPHVVAGQQQSKSLAIRSKKLTADDTKAEGLRTTHP